jgi:HPt (histidine-containing phosphotransfer) domain-containing protein
MNDFVSKPIDRSALVHALRRWLPQLTTPGELGSAPEVAVAPFGEPRSPVLEGIEIEPTIRRLGIPFETLRPMLLRFAEGERKTLENLRAAVTQGDRTAASRHAHSLAGAAGNLGAHGLGGAAKALELAARDGGATLPELLGAVERQAATVFRSIDSLRFQAGGNSGPPETTAPSFDSRKWRASLKALQAALANFDLSASSELLQRIMQQGLPEDLDRHANRLKELIDAYEYDQAGDIVKQMLERLPEESPV